MRVYDPNSDIDAVFNYGIFSFDEHFYFNFTMGRLNYKLGVQSMDGFVRSYQYEKRGVIEQVLALDSAQKQAVFDFLDWNYQPENRYYLYDFFYDNCSSRLRDVLQKALKDSNVEFKDLSYDHAPSFRTMIDEYLIYHPWGDFGIDLGLGMPCDKVPSAEEYMFLPNELMRAYDGASINNKPLVEEKRVLLTEAGLKTEWSLFNPVPLMWLFFGIIAGLSAIGWRRKRLFIGIDVFYLFLTGAVGALVFFLWFITDHNATANNYNMLWAWPTHILLIPMIFISAVRKWYWLIYGAVLLITLLMFPFLPQDLHFATLPIILAGLLRSVVNITWKNETIIQPAEQKQLDKK